MTSRSAPCSLYRLPSRGVIGKPIPFATTCVAIANVDIFPSDDLTVQVIFFGHGEKTGEVTVNLDATAAEDLRAKL